MIEFGKVTKQFADKVLLENASFSIYDGERVGIVGSNGSGKTTIIRMINGEEPADSGFVSNTSGSVGYLKQITEYSNNDFLQIASDPEFARDFMAISSWLNISKDIDFSAERLSQLSGGEKTKLMLAHILSKNPDTLLLDEPTNHMDQAGVNWLIDTLNAFSGTVVVVSHDRYFLNSAVDKIIEVENQKVTEYYGSYDDYYSQKQQKLKEQRQRFESQIALEKKIDRQIERLNSWSNKAEKESRRQGGMMSDSKIKGAQTRAQVSAGKLAGQAKAKISRLEQAKGEFVDRPYEEGEVFYKLEAQPIGSKVLLRAEDVSKKFGDHLLFENANFTIMAGEKVALKGNNGTGKTTLIKMILGQDRDFDGIIWSTPALKPTYLSQDVLDLDANKTVMEMAMQGNAEYRTQFLSNLANMNMSRQVFNRKIKTLSLGERMRLKMCEIILSDFNFLIMDEPTNHLDLPNKIFLEKILKGYNGALLLVSHDKTLCDSVCDSELVIENQSIKKKELMSESEPF